VSDVIGGVGRVGNFVVRMVRVSIVVLVMSVKLFCYLMVFFMYVVMGILSIVVIVVFASTIVSARLCCLVGVSVMVVAVVIGV